MTVERAAAARGGSGSNKARGTRRKAAAHPEHRQEAPLGDAGHRRELLRQMLLIRRFEERCVELYSAAKIRGFVHLYIGEEAVAVGVNQALNDQDSVVATYREHGQALARGVPAAAIMCEMYGRSTGCSSGRGGSMHLFDASRRFYGGNAIVGGGIPLAGGLALADRMRGEDRVTCCFFGDGAFAEGEFHEVANLAVLWRLPLLLVCENNLYAMGTALAREHAQTNLALRASAYGMPAWTVDGMDVLAVEAAARRAAEAVRAGGGPYFLEARTYRFRAHSMYDPDRYRDKAEVERWRSRDPVDALETTLRAGGEPDGFAEEIAGQVDAEIDEAVHTAERAPVEPVERLLRYVTTPVEAA